MIIKTLFAAVIITTFIACNSNTHNPPGSKDSLVVPAPSPDSLEKKKENTNKQIAIASVTAFGDHHADQVFKEAAPGFIEYGDGSGTPIRGYDSATAVIEIFMKAFSDIHVRDIKAIAEGDSVAVFAEWIGTFKNSFMGIKPTGITTRLRDCDIYKFNQEGKILSHRSTQNTSQYLYK
jgi:predicted ester cyclase